MPFRVTDSATNARLTSQIATSRQRFAKVQEQLASGKRINRPSDDPVGAGDVLRLRTKQTELEQFSRNVDVTRETLQVGDNVLDSYQQLLDDARALMTRAATDPVVLEARVPIAIELEGMISRIQQLANTKSGDAYVFGGTRLDAPPYDANGVPAATPTTEITIQVEPEGTLIATGVTAESFLDDGAGSVIDALKTAATAIRGTGTWATDHATILGTVDRLKGFSELSNQARTKLGERLNHADEISTRLSQYNLSVEESAQRIETVDVAEAAIALKESDTALNAILQAASQFGRRSLLDFIG